MAEAKPKVLIVEARYYDKINDDILKGIHAELEAAGVEWDHVTVPGAFEIPTAVEFALRAMEEIEEATEYAGFISVGCVIRGATDHYDHICRETSRALMELSLSYAMPHGFGVLTCENREQAEERADPARKNKGKDAAEACLSLMKLKTHFGLDTE